MKLVLFNTDPALTQAWVVLDYNLPDWDLGIPYCPPMDIESLTAKEISTELTSASDIFSNSTQNKYSTAALSAAKVHNIHMYFIVLSVVCGYMILM